MIPVGIVFKDEVCVTVSFHQTEMLTDFVPLKERISILKINFDLVLRLLFHYMVFEITETSQSKKLN
jgi:magnesium transporter